MLHIKVITQSTVWYFRNVECEVTAANGLDSKKTIHKSSPLANRNSCIVHFYFRLQIVFVCLFLFRKNIDGIINISIARTTDYNKNNALIICTRVWIHPISKILLRQIVNPLIILHDYKINVQCFDNGIFFIKQILIENTFFLQYIYSVLYACIYAQLAHFRNNRKKSAIQFGELVFQLKLDSICST